MRAHSHCGKNTEANNAIKLFLEVLLICDQTGLIGKKMFAIDGCKLLSDVRNADIDKDQLMKRSRCIIF